MKKLCDPEFLEIIRKYDIVFEPRLGVTKIQILKLKVTPHFPVLALSRANGRKETVVGWSFTAKIKWQVV